MGLSASELLRRVVSEITGLPDPVMREGQVRTMSAVGDVMRERDRVIVKAPTGTGKSLAYLVPAVVMAVESGERTVVSTESLALQDQIVSKDFPLVSRCATQMGARPASVAVLKGWSNYVCPRAVQGVVDRVLAEKEEKSAKAKAEVKAKPQDEPAASDDLETPLQKWNRDYRVHAQKMEDAGFPVVAWALRLDPVDDVGDKADYDGVSPKEGLDEVWNEQVSVPSTACPSECPLAGMCFAKKSREAVDSADVVVTNHSLVAIQAANDIPAVFGNKTVGTVHHLVVDEAHSLPSKVRDAGSGGISSSRVASVVAAFARVYTPTGPLDAAIDFIDRHISTVSSDLVGRHRALMKNLDEQIAKRGKKSANGIMEDWENTLPPDLVDSLKRWLAEIRQYASDAVTPGGPQEIPARKALVKAQAFLEDVETFFDPERRAVARWFELPDARDDSVTPKLRLSPVDVGPLLNHSVYRAKVYVPRGVDVMDFLEDHPELRLGSDGDVWRELSVSLVSATLNKTFPREAGLSHLPVVAVQSPFGEAYKRSLLYIPSSKDTRLPSLPERFGRFNTSDHPQWAVELIVRMVELNGGSALVLASNSAAGKLYLGRLTAAARGRWEVFSQWNGMSRSAATEKWRADKSAVLVGTRGLMTGVDAPGDTNTLVIVDRIPRDPQSAINEARVAALTESGMKLFAARNAVYAGDAAVLLEQAVGRLIRSVDDSGLVAVLDPRLVTGYESTYSPATRGIYKEALSSFPNNTIRFADVEVFLADRAQRAA